MKEEKATSWKLNEYPKIEKEDIDFPEEINLVYAVCGQSCSLQEIIVQGSTEICQYCNKRMKLIGKASYTLDKIWEDNK
ncbi:MAG: hypothetical protein OEZ51_06130 [Nitrospinota bacterium]|nr:hypothetical protein [Nitrospinota bacterium]